MHACTVDVMIENPEGTLVKVSIRGAVSDTIRHSLIKPSAINTMWTPLHSLVELTTPSGRRVRLRAPVNDSTLLNLPFKFAKKYAPVALTTKPKGRGFGTSVKQTQMRQTKGVSEFCHKLMCTDECTQLQRMIASTVPRSKLHFAQPHTPARNHLLYHTPARNRLHYHIPARNHLSYHTCTLQHTQRILITAQSRIVY
eukprot:GHVR01059399.1.p1 GENE.GHVR01059399.1~~GHVR01059399.1.p1  ORF type:complete len:198 (-),score=14.29 GHVR01059399.1:172-765(-)